MLRQTSLIIDYVHVLNIRINENFTSSLVSLYMIKIIEYTCTRTYFNETPFIFFPCELIATICTSQLSNKVYFSSFPLNQINFSLSKQKFSAFTPRGEALPIILCILTAKRIKGLLKLAKKIGGRTELWPSTFNYC